MTARPAHAVRKLKEGGGQSVWLVHRPDQELRTLKSWTLTPRLLVKLLLGIAQPQRQIAGARRLARAGIPVAGVLGGWRVGWLGRPVVHVELAFIPGRSALTLSRDESVDVQRRRRIAAALGRVVARMAAARLFNRDLKLANLIIDEAGEPWMIDTVDVRPMRSADAETARMLERLSIQIEPGGLVRCPATWVPAMRGALRALPRPSRRAVVEALKRHRRERSS